MTREQFAESIGWSYIIWTFGIINVFAMLPQIIQIVRTRRVEGLSLGMFVIYFVVGIAYSLHGFFHHDTMLMATLGLCACMSFTIIVLIKTIRRRSST